MTALLIATRNRHKTEEIQEILGPHFRVRDLSQHPETPPIAESGETFEDNAIAKATTVSRELAGLVLADDSGLEVDVLGGAPGIFSARYAGGGASDADNIKKLLRELQRTAEWRSFPSRDRLKEQVEDLPYSLPLARFRCVIALAREGKLLKTFDGIVEGKIIDAPRGAGGFGYDPIFVPQNFEQTFAEMSRAAKNRISHRAKALRQAVVFLKSTRP